MFRNKRAQTLNEYAMVFIIMATSFLMLQVYLKRGIQSVIKSTADDLSMPAQDIYKMGSQSLGVMEPGLVEYKDVQVRVNSEKESTLDEYPQTHANPVRILEVVKDDSAVYGKWTTIYKLALGGGESFNANERTRRAVSGNINTNINNVVVGK